MFFYSKINTLRPTYVSIEQADVAVALEICIQEMLCSNLGREVGFLVPRLFVIILSPSRQNPSLNLKLGHDRFLPNCSNS
jgi:hypothetical protein